MFEKIFKKKNETTTRAVNPDSEKRKIASENRIVVAENSGGGPRTQEQQEKMEKIRKEEEILEETRKRYGRQTEQALRREMREKNLTPEEVLARKKQRKNFQKWLNDQGEHLKKAIKEAEEELKKERETARSESQKPDAEEGLTPQEMDEIPKVAAEIEKMPQEKREKIGVGLRNLGFWVEEKKQRFFSGLFKKIASRLDKRSAMGRFVVSLAETSETKAETARKKMERLEREKRGAFGSFGYLVSNILKYGRTVADIIGWTVASPLRYVMLGSMTFSRGSEAAKEARLKNEKVIEKTRIKDIEAAADEAWKIYKEAEVASGGKAPTKEELQKAYQKNLPEDLLKRLEQNPEPGVASGILQRVLRKHIERQVLRIDKKIKAIEENENLSEEEKKARAEKILNKFSLQLKDLDRLVGQYGTVDALALGAKYGEKVGKVVTYGVMAETLVLALENLGHVLANLFSSTEIPEPTFVETAGKGEGVWHMAKDQLAKHFGDKFTHLDPARKIYVIDAVKDRIAENPHAFGLENIDQVKVGQEIDFSPILGDKEWVRETFSSASDLTDKAIANINDQAERIQSWLQTHHGEALTTEKVKEILAGDINAGVEPIKPELPALPTLNEANWMNYFDLTLEQYEPVRNMTLGEFLSNFKKITESTKTELTELGIEPSASTVWDTIHNLARRGGIKLSEIKWPHMKEGLDNYKIFEKYYTLADHLKNLNLGEAAKKLPLGSILDKLVK
jgi:hypothetical protein